MTRPTLIGAGIKGRLLCSNCDNYVWFSEVRAYGFDAVDALYHPNEDTVPCGPVYIETTA